MEFPVARVDRLGVFSLLGASLLSLLCVALGGRILPPQGRVTWLGVYRSGHPCWPSSFGGWTIPFGGCVFVPSAGRVVFLLWQRVGCGAAWEE